MAGIRLRCDHRDLSGAVRTLFIYDRELLSSQDNIVLCTSDFYSLKHEGDVNDPFKRIIPCNCQFTIFLKHPNYTEAEQDEVNLFFNDLITSHEGRFYVRCQYGETLGEIEQEFFGKILPDIGELTLDQWETVQITAIDGISGLKDVEYRPTGYTDLTPEFAIKTTKFKDHFIDIIKRNDVVQFFQETLGSYNNVLITTSAFWTESKSVPGDIFNQVKVRNTYFEKVGKTYRKYKSCYEALEDLLTGFVARCIYASGKYHIEQLPYQDNLTLTRYGYKYDGDIMTGGPYGNKQTINYTTNNNIRALTFPSKRWLAPFKAIELSQSKQFTNYMNGMNIYVPGNEGPHNFGNVIASGSKMIIQWRFEFENIPNITPIRTILPTLRMIVKVGDYYLNFPGGTCRVWKAYNADYFVLLSDQTIPIMEWSTTPTIITVEFFLELLLNKTTAESFKIGLQNINFIVESLEIQDDGAMIFEFLDFKLYDFGPEIPTDPDIKIKMTSSSRIILASGYNDLFEIPKSIKKYEVGDIRNTLIYKTDLSYFDSSLQMFEQLFIRNSIYVSTDEPTVEWTDPDSDITLPIQDLMLKTMLAMRQYPAQVFKMEFIYLDKAIFRMDHRVAINNELYIPIDLEIFAGTGVHRVSLLKVYKDFEGINIVEIDEPEPEQQFPTPDGSLGSAFGGGGRNGVQYYEEWTNVSTNYVILDNLAGYIGDEYSVKTKFHFIVNGIRQKYTPGVAPTPNVQNREFDVDFSTDRIYFGKGSGNVKHVELIVYY